MVKIALNMKFLAKRAEKSRLKIRYGYWNVSSLIIQHSLKVFIGVEKRIRD